MKDRTVDRIPSSIQNEGMLFVWFFSVRKLLEHVNQGIVDSITIANQYC
jgi:hypothetical protein